MKPNPVPSVLIILTTAIMLFSCNKKSDTTQPQPDYPQLVGSWQGTTSQGLPIKLGVTAVGGILVVSSYKYDVIKYNSGSANQTMNYDVPGSTIVTSITNRYFGFRPYGGYSYTDYLKGTFDVTAMTLAGRFNTSFPNASGTKTDSVTGSFSATKVN
jgi:hypothetical protein